MILFQMYIRFLVFTKTLSSYFFVPIILYLAIETSKKFENLSSDEEIFIHSNNLYYLDTNIQNPLHFLLIFR